MNLPLSADVPSAQLSEYAQGLFSALKVPPLTIGAHRLPNCVVLAPMAGVTDLPFRQIAHRLGAGMVVAEMLTADKRLWKSEKSRLRLEFGTGIQPRVVQIAGGDASMLADAAAAVEQLGADIIDINMGCPAKKVCKKAAGSALMKDEVLVGQILEAVTAATTIPITLKIRSGWSLEQQNAVAIARIAEQSGISALTVHGRSRACKFAGVVDYGVIAAVKSAVNIPVIANGDIDTAEKAAHVLYTTAADGVMIGRAALGKPWLLGQIAHYVHNEVKFRSPSVQDVRKLALEHLATLRAFYGEFMGTKIARKHVAWYLQNYAGSASFRRDFNCLESAEEQERKLSEFFELLIRKDEGIAA